VLDRLELKGKKSKNEVFLGIKCRQLRGGGGGGGGGAVKGETIYSSFRKVDRSNNLYTYEKK